MARKKKTTEPEAATTPVAAAPEEEKEEAAQDTQPEGETPAPAPNPKTCEEQPAPQDAPAAAQEEEPSEGFTIKRILKVTKPLVKGRDVKAVQKALIARGFFCGVDGATGIYGGQTAAAVRKFQAMNRLVVTGRVEKFTTAALGGIWQE